MNIELIDKNKVLIDLCDDDMQRLSIEYTTLQERKNISVIKTLIEIAKIKTGLITNAYARIMVDTMPYDGGCFILITLKQPNFLSGKKFRIIKKSFERIFVFDSTDDMINATEKLCRCHCRHYKSSLLLYKGNYCLLIESVSGIEKFSVHLLCEYACTNYANSVKIAHIKEHATTVITQNAVETIGKAFS